jgi:hypothetical protein
MKSYKRPFAVASRRSCAQGARRVGGANSSHACSTGGQVGLIYAAVVGVATLVMGWRALAFTVVLYVCVKRSQTSNPNDGAPPRPTHQRH